MCHFKVSYQFSYLIDEIPTYVNKEMQHWVIFVFVLVNKFERFRPLSLDQAGGFSR